MNELMLVRRDDLVSGITDAVIPLKAELAECKKVRDQWCKEFTEQRDDAIALTKLCAELQTKIRKYGGHTANCAYHLGHYKGPVHQCDCGWTEEVTANNRGENNGNA